MFCYSHGNPGLKGIATDSHDDVCDVRSRQLEHLLLHGWLGLHGSATVLSLGKRQEVLDVEALKERNPGHPHVVALDQRPLV